MLTCNFCYNHQMKNNISAAHFWGIEKDENCEKQPKQTKIHKYYSFFNLPIGDAIPNQNHIRSWQKAWISWYTKLCLSQAFVGRAVWSLQFPLPAVSESSSILSLPGTPQFRAGSGWLIIHSPHRNAPNTTQTFLFNPVLEQIPHL